MLGLALAATFTSCKKDQTTLDDGPGKLKDRVDLKMTLPGQSAQEVYLVQQPNGTYQAAWYGNMVFGDIPHPTINVKNGQPIPAIEVLDPNSEYLEILTTGPYFTVIRPTFLGSVSTIKEKFGEFEDAYADYISAKKDEYGTLKQPTLPNLDTYIENTGNGEIIIKGMIVSSTASPSKMSIVPHTFVPPAPTIPAYLLFPDYTVGNIRYDITGNNLGTVQGVTAVDINTNQNVPIYGFSGSYTELSNGIHVQDLIIWTSPTTFITYTGNL